MNNLKLIRTGVFLFCVSIGINSYCQTPKDYKKHLDNPAPIESLEEANSNPDSVISLRLQKQKLTKFPKEIRQFKNLEVLDLKKNEIDSVPAWIGELQNLRVLVLSKNNLTVLPDEICLLKNLIVFQAGENQLTHFPEGVNNLVNLEFLDLWSNEIEYLPPPIQDLKNLKLLDMRITLTNREIQEAIREMLPDTKIYFSAPCKCGD